MSDSCTPQQLIDSLKAEKLNDLSGLVAVITGGSTGIGLMMTTTLLANGAKVYIIGLDQAQVDYVVAIYDRVVGGRLVGLAGDVSKKSEAVRLATEINKHEGYVNVLFNNAGVIGPSNEDPKSDADDIDAYVHKLDAYTEDDFHKVLSINSIAPWFMSVAFLKLLNASKAHPRGSRFPASIIITSSMNAYSKDPATAGRTIPYLLSKSAVAHLTKLLAHELLPLDIHVNGIAPGLFATGMTSQGVNPLGFSTISREQCAEEAIFAVPGGKSGRHQDVGALALMLATNHFINGEIVLIDGGTLLVHPASY
ncbi:NAD(P)-binding protein [Auriculariales sp. MPI-PUGE-AT-0066]|nr:NAD(P)-binding protein [Auriculariales sp. MPI-PUGE-AT-0066]